MEDDFYQESLAVGSVTICFVLNKIVKWVYVEMLGLCLEGMIFVWSSPGKAGFLVIVVWYVDNF